MARTLVTGGTVVSATGRMAADVLIEGETIAALGRPGLFASAEPGADRVIDATGRYVIPGGVDVHTHMELPVGEVTSADTFETGTVAAAWGGVTTIVDFATQAVGEDVRDSLAAWHAKADGRCAVDYGFHQILGDVDAAALDALRHLTEHEGVTSFKLFMAYPGRLYSDDGQILRAMQVAGEVGATTMVHAENGIAIDVLVAQARTRGATDPVHHSLTRPSALEGEATHRAIVLAEVAGHVPLYIVHLSASEALAHVAEARGRGRNVFAETCPQYLYLTVEDTLARGGAEGARFICSPPIRSTRDGHDHHADLWRGLRTDDLCVVSTDHCPFCAREKDRGQGDFSTVPNGLGTVEHRLELLYQGVVAGEISLERWVETCCTTPARMFGMHPRKGVLAPGSDADVVVWDPAGRTRLGLGGKHHMAVDHSAWEGWEVPGRVEIVLSRGQVVVEGGAFTGRIGHGRYVPRGLSQYLV